MLILTWQEMMRDFENQEQQDGDEDEADQARVSFQDFGIGQFGKGQAAEFNMEHPAISMYFNL